MVAYHQTGLSRPPLVRLNPSDSDSWLDPVPAARLADFLRRPRTGVDWRDRHYSLLPPRDRSSSVGTKPGRARDIDIFRDVQRFGIADKLGGRPSGASRKRGHARRYFKSGDAWILVGALALAVAGRGTLSRTLLP